MGRKGVGVFTSQNTVLQNNVIAINIPKATDKTNFNTDADQINYQGRFVAQPIYCHGSTGDYIAIDDTDAQVTTTWASLSGEESGDVLTSTALVPAFSTDMKIQLEVRAVDDTETLYSKVITTIDMFAIKNDSADFIVNNISWKNNSVTVKAQVKDSGFSLPANVDEIRGNSTLTAAFNTWRYDLAAIFGDVNYKALYSIKGTYFPYPNTLANSFNLRTWDWVNDGIEFTLNNLNQEDNYQIKLILDRGGLSESSGAIMHNNRPKTVIEFIIQSGTSSFQIANNGIRSTYPNPNDKASTASAMLARTQQHSNEEDVEKGHSVALYDSHIRTGESVAANEPSIGFMTMNHEEIGKIGVESLRKSDGTSIGKHIVLRNDDMEMPVAVRTSGNRLQYWDEGLDIWQDILPAKMVSGMNEHIQWDFTGGESGNEPIVIHMKGMTFTSKDGFKFTTGALTPDSLSVELKEELRGKSLRLNTSNTVFVYDADNNPFPSGQIIDLTVDVQGITGSVDWNIKGYNVEGTEVSIPTTIINNKHIKINIDSIGNNVQKIVATVSLENNGEKYTDTLTLLKLKNGLDGVGRGVKSISEWLLSTNKNTGVTKADLGWTKDGYPEISKSKPYLWKYTSIVYSDDNVEETEPVLVGAFGIDGRSVSKVESYYATSTRASGVAVADLTWVKTPVNPTNEQPYLWNYDRITYTDNVNPTILGPRVIGVKGKDGKDGIDGIDGLQGPRGEQGIQGPKGANGVSSYTHIAYANNSTGTSGFSVSDSTNKSYIGMYVDPTPTDSTDPTKYKWTLIKGLDGQNGTPGPKGDDGRTPYLHIAYATNATGTTGFSTTVSAGKTYIGQYTDFTEPDSTDPAKYSWTLIKGDRGEKGDKGVDGLPGKDGVGLASTDVSYTGSTSGTSTPTSGWVTTIPTVAAGNYLWTKTVWTYTDGKTETGYSVSRIGKDGNTGKDGVAGKDGVGLTNTTITYSKHTNGTTPPTTGWADQPPSANDGEFIWTRTIWNYTDGTSETGYSVGKIGESGISGQDAVPNKTYIAYADDNKGTGFTLSPVGKKYMGVLTAPDIDYLTQIGTNEISNSNFANGLDQWRVINSESKPVIDSGKTGVNITSSGSGGIYATPNIKVGDKVSFSFMAKKTSENGAVRIGFLNQSSSYNIIQELTSELKRYELTPDFPIQEGNAYFHIYNYRSNESFFITDIVLTKTEQPLSWKPAPSDIQLLINDSSKYKWSLIKGDAFSWNLLKDTKDLEAGGLNFEPGSRQEYQAVQINPDYKNLTLPTDVTISFDVEHYNEKPFNMQVYNSNRKGPHIIKATMIEMIPPGKTRQKTLTTLSVREDAALSYDSLEFFSVYGTNNWYKISNIKIEEGDVLNTEWSPHPEDLNGVGINSTTVTYGTSTTATTQPTAWQSSIPNVPVGQYLWTRIITDYTDELIPDTVSYTYAYQGKNGATGATGATGTSVTVSKIEYQAGTSATTAPTGIWSANVVAVASGQFLWTKTIFSDGKIAYGVAKQGADGAKGDIGPIGPKGVDGKSINNITDYYLATSASTGVTTTTAGWSTTIPTLTETNKYLWRYEKINYINPTSSSSTTPVIIGMFSKDGNNGAAGRGISSITNYYKLTNTTTTPAIDTSWGTTPLTTTTTNRYLWNYEKIVYINPAGTTNTTPAIISTHGATGPQGPQGVEGPKGDNGRPTYTWIKYADTPTSGMDNSPVGKKYIGLSFNQVTQTESDNYNDYQWSLMPQNIEIGGRNLLRNSEREVKAVGREFVQFADLAPIFEEHGLDEVYSLSLDLKSADISNRSMIQVYMQNGNGTKYNFVNSSVIVTEEYQRFKFEGLTPSLSMPTETKAVLAFYGTYDTGNRPIVRNVKLEKGNVATDWTPAPEDTQSEIDSTKEQIKKTVKTITEEYYQSTSATSQTGGEWTTTAPTWQEGKFIFIRSEITYVDGTTSYTPIVNITGAKGDTGSQGPQGPKGATGAIGPKGEDGRHGIDLSMGEMVYKDPSFLNGMNEIDLYSVNAQSRPYLTVRRVSSSADNPVVSPYMIKVNTILPQSPGFGGVHQRVTSRKKAVYVHRLIAKIPAGRRLVLDDSLGNNKKYTYLTSMEGTGYFEEYLIKLETTPYTVGDFGFFYIDGGATPTEANPLTWYIAYLTTFDLYAGSTLQANHTWIKYGNAGGADMSDTPNRLTHIGIATNKFTNIPSKNASDYSWAAFNTSRVPDPIVANRYVWFKFADNELGEGISNNPTGKSWVGIALNKTSVSATSAASDYEWRQIYKVQTSTQPFQPVGAAPGHLWIDTSVSPPVIKKYNGDVWEDIADTSELLAEISNKVDSATAQQIAQDMGMTILNEVQATFQSLSSDVNGFSMEFSEYQTLVDSSLSELGVRINETKDYINFIDGKIILGTTQNNFSVEISNEKISFKDGGEEVAYINNQELFINDARVQKKLTFGVESGDKIVGFFVESNGLFLRRM